MNAEGLLRRYFGHDEFRGAQREVIDSILAHRDALAIMPTGAGKSICYQIPALMLPGITLVVSPLISLMHDQVLSLVQSGIPAAYVNSTLSARQHAEVLRRARMGAYKIIYVAPERLETEGFLTFAAQQEISMVAVDEAHCISQWGQDFRPSYLKITEFVDRLDKRPIVAAFTATATERVRRDIIHALKLQDPSCTVTGFNRKNLYFEVQQPKDKDSALLELVRERRRACGIVYCATRKNVESVCDLLNENGVSATRYHAGLPAEERKANQDDFLYDRKLVMVATNAFGMGIDKSNVSYIIHYNMPGDLESYYQEAGRAGRDGSAADCILLFNKRDILTQKFFIEQTGTSNLELSEEEAARLRSRDLHRLNQMVDYCQSRGCLREKLLGYFGEKLPQPCKNCSTCLPNAVDTDITREGQMVLSCIYRVKRQGYQPGKELILDILQGKAVETVVRLKLDQLSTFGLMKEMKAAQIEEVVSRLEVCGYLREQSCFCPMLFPTEKAAKLLKGEHQLMLRKSQPIRKERAAKELPKGSEALFDALKETRSQLAKRESVPAYVICADATLRDMCRKLPRDMRAFRQVSGIGDIKAQKYGTAFLKTIEKYRNK